MIEELDSVALTTDLPEYGFKAGDVGVVVDISPSGRQYLLEFFNVAGKTIDIVPVRPEQVRPIDRSREIRSVRVLEKTT